MKISRFLIFDAVIALAISCSSDNPLKRYDFVIAGDNTLCVKELDRDGNTVWEITQEDVPFPLHNIQTAYKRPNGNVIFNDWIAGQDTSTWAGTVQFCEMTPSKEIVWTLSSWENPDLGPSTAIEIIRQRVK